MYQNAKGVTDRSPVKMRLSPHPDIDGNSLRLEVEPGQTQSGRKWVGYSRAVGFSKQASQTHCSHSFAEGTIWSAESAAISQPGASERSKRRPGFHQHPPARRWRGFCPGKQIHLFPAASSKNHDCGIPPQHPRSPCPPHFSATAFPESRSSLGERSRPISHPDASGLDSCDLPNFQSRVGAERLPWAAGPHISNPEAVV